MAYVSTHSEVRLTDDMERALVAAMARDNRPGLLASIKNVGSAIAHCAAAFGTFLDGYADTVDEAARRASHHGHYI